MNDRELLDSQKSGGIKGLLVCMVLISHLSARVALFSTSLLGTMFSACGYLAVSMFFFLSGFGLYQRYHQSGDGYVKTFFGKKIVPYYAMCCIVILIYLIRDLLVGGSVDWVVFAQSFLFGGTIVDMGWYLQAQLVLYLLFYLAFRFARKKTVFWNCLLIVLYCIGCAAAGLPTTWYEGVLCFALGMLCAKHKETIQTRLGSIPKAILLCVILMLAFLGTLFLGNKQILPEPIRICVKMVSALCFDGWLLLLFVPMKRVNPISRFLGKYSFEMYVTQGMFLYGFRPIISNDWLYMLAVIAAALLLSWIVHPVFSWVNKQARAGFGRKKEEYYEKR